MAVDIPPRKLYTIPRIEIINNSVIYNLYDSITFVGERECGIDTYCFFLNEVSSCSCQIYDGRKWLPNAQMVT